MLTELQGLQSSDEDYWSIELSFDIQTREEAEELIHRTYTFGYAPEWDKWTFIEYKEERSPNELNPNKRQWRESTHITWDDPDESREITVPSEVADALKEATTADSVMIQIPVGSAAGEYDKVYNTN